MNYVKLKGKIHLSSCVITDTNVFAISMVTFRACAAEAPLQIVTRRVFCAWPLACFAFIHVWMESTESCYLNGLFWIWFSTGNELWLIFVNVRGMKALTSLATQNDIRWNKTQKRSRNIGNHFSVPYSHQDIQDSEENYRSSTNNFDTSEACHWSWRIWPRESCYLIFLLQYHCLFVICVRFFVLRTRAGVGFSQNLKQNKKTPEGV